MGAKGSTCNSISASTRCGVARWARGVAGCLKPGGRLYQCEAHPVGMMIDHESDYANTDAVFQNTKTFEWSHPVSKILNALIAAGLTLDWLHEHDRIAWKLLPIMEPDEHRQFGLPADFPIRVPLALSSSAAEGRLTRRHRFPG